jgi:flagellar biosynthesis protein FlhA
MNQLLKFLLPAFKFISNSKDLTFVILFVAILAIIIVPLPSGVLDFFLTISLSVGVLILLISLFIEKPTDLTTFPTLILIITLYRLSLNVATTRMILSEGHQGPGAVSDIIQSFGDFVVGGNYVIGIIVFSILVIINFMVVTKGSTRVAEVSARFTLDAMPGKQMAIDADLNAGMIDEATARARREEVIKEASFYGAMDGSSKFVQGDAIAGIIITIINIIGGLLIGVFSHGLDFATSAQTFTVLTIGDGLVSQIPALIISTATGIIITRATKDDEVNFATGAVDQLIKDHKVLFIVGFILVVFALVPGLPTLSLGFVGIVFLSMGYLIKMSKEGGLKKLFESVSPQSIQKNQQQKEEQTKKEEKSPSQQRQEEEQKLQDILKVEILELDLGYQLIKLADSSQGGDILERIKTMRRKIAEDYGFLMPQIRIRDNLHLQPQQYQLLLKGVEIGIGESRVNKFLAMDNGLVAERIDGEATKEPAFGLDAIWIDASQKEDAIMKGYTVVDSATVISTHISELVKKHAPELLTRQEIQKLIDGLKADYPVIVEDALKSANIGLIQKVLKSLLASQIPIKDMLTILETVADVGEYTKNIDILVEHVRAKLSRVITKLYKDENNTIHLITFNAATEKKLMESIREKDGIRDLVLSIAQINTLVETVSAESAKVLQQGIAPAIFIVDPVIRKPLDDIFKKFGLEVVVLSHAEVDSAVQFEVMGSVDIATL